MREIVHDLRYAVRLLAARPGFTLVAVATLALGIGANTAIFSVVHGVLLQPLPYEEPDELVLILELEQRSGRPFGASPVNFRDWRQENRTFDGMSAIWRESFNLVGDGEPERLGGGMVSAGFFALMGAPPALGRDLLPEDDRPGAEPVVVLGHDLWKRRFGADPRIVGRTLTLNGVPTTVVGVA